VPLLRHVKQAGFQLHRTLGNLFRLYRPLLGTLHFFDNSSDPPHLIFKDEAGPTTITDAALYERLRRELSP
jgi:hypothetical protein